MIPPQFEYHAPSSVREAVDLLRNYGGEAKVLAGGQSLLPLMKLRLAEPRALVDLNRIQDLAYIREEGDFLRIGAMARTNDLQETEVVAQRYPILADAGSVIADPLVRNMGTVGGNVAHGDPANDLPACMLALGARYVVQGPEGSRTVPAEDFYESTFLTALEPDEILTEIRIPKARSGQGTAYVKMEKRVGDFPMVGVAASLRKRNGEVKEAGLGLTAVGPTALKAREAEEALVGTAADDEAVGRAAALAREVTDPVSDLRGPAEYKRAMVEVLARRALRRARERAGDG